MTYIAIQFLRHSVLFLSFISLSKTDHLKKHSCPIQTWAQLDMNRGIVNWSKTMAGNMSTALKTKLSDWSFSDPLLATLPVDSLTSNVIRSNVPKVIFSQVRPTPFKTQPKLVATSSLVLRDILDMDPEEMPKDPDFVEWVSGNKVLAGSFPLAHRYGGHQFGNWAGQLGDGRAHLLGEYINSQGQRWELQLKGSGRTPYSRFGDGRAVLRSSVREFLCSESMFHLGIPTSRAASLIVTDDLIPRDIFYNGNPKPEPCAVVLRIAPTWFRIGSLEILSTRGELDELRTLLDFLITNNYPEIKREVQNPDDQTLALFSQFVRDSADLVASWMSVGFTHGVLNTDNLSLGSVTIDYGPFGFLDKYDPYFIPNHSDDSGRYDYASQPEIVHWNLERMANALMPIISEDKKPQLKQILGGYFVLYEQAWTKLFCQKLGLTYSENTLKADKRLAEALLSAMYSSGSDFTQTFRDLSELSFADLQNCDTVCGISHWGLAKVRTSKQFLPFLTDFLKRIKEEFGEDDFDEKRMERMQAANPRYILRNWIAQQAIEAAEDGDFTQVQLVLKILENPFKTQLQAEAVGYAKPVPGWSKNLVVSCSS